MDRKNRFLLRLSIPFGLMLAAAGLRTPAAQVDGVDLLPPSAAFRLEVSRPQAERVRIRWTIAEGYYLYRERFRFEATPAKLVETFTLPRGIVKQDPFFGETEIYRRRVAFELPLEPGAAALEPVSLQVVSQGCADIGICFPPETRSVQIGIGETVVTEGEDLFAPVGAGQAEDPLYPLPFDLSRPPTPSLSP